MFSEKLDVDLDLADHWKANILPDLLKDYNSLQIFNTDETRTIPEHSHMFKAVSREGCKELSNV